MDSDCGLGTKTLCAARYGQKKANGILQMTYFKQLDNLKMNKFHAKQSQEEIDNLNNPSIEENKFVFRNLSTKKIPGLNSKFYHCLTGVSDRDLTGKYYQFYSDFQNFGKETSINNFKRIQLT